MLPAHALRLAAARSYLAALADQATSAEASSAYEQTLWTLDWIHGDDAPAHEDVGRTPRAFLADAAQSAIEDLAISGLDALHVGLLLAVFADALALDQPRGRPDHLRSEDR